MQCRLSSPCPPLKAFRSSAIVIAVLAISASLYGPGLCEAQSERAYRIVVHPDNPISALPTSEASDLFLGKTQTWAHGPSVRVVERPLRSALRGAFTHDMHDRSVESVYQLWQRRILSGRVKAPDLADSDADVLRIVASDPGAVGYVSADTDLIGVRELPVVEVPERIAYQAPQYTSAARQAGVQGVVVLRLSVDEEGRVSNVGVIKDLPMGLTSEATRSARLWRYEPAHVGDRPVGVSFDVAVQFAIQGTSSTR